MEVEKSEFEIIPFSKEFTTLLDLHYIAFSTSPVWITLFPLNNSKQHTKTQEKICKLIMQERIDLTGQNIYILKRKNDNKVLGCVTMEFKCKNQQQQNKFFSIIKFLLKLIYFVQWIELMKLFYHLMILLYYFFISYEVKIENHPKISLKNGYWHLSCYALDSSLQGKGIGEYFLNQIYCILNINHPIILHTQHPKLVKYYQNLEFNVINERKRKLKNEIITTSYTLIKSIKKK